MGPRRGSGGGGGGNWGGGSGGGGYSQDPGRGGGGYRRGGDRGGGGGQQQPQQYYDNRGRGGGGSGGWGGSSGRSGGSSGRSGGGRSGGGYQGRGGGSGGGGNRFGALASYYEEPPPPPQRPRGGFGGGGGGFGGGGGTTSFGGGGGGRGGGRSGADQDYRSVVLQDIKTDRPRWLLSCYAIDRGDACTLGDSSAVRPPRPYTHTHTHTHTQTRRAEARKLVEAFGSTRRKRQLKQREEGAVQVDRNADEKRLGLLMNEVAARAATTGETRKVMARVGAVRAIPPHDPKARQPHLASKIAAMFPEQLLSALNVGQLMHAAEKAEDRERLASKGLVPAYIISRRQRITAQERKRRVRLLALLSALLQLAAARPRLVLKPPRPAKEEGGKERPGGLEELTWQLRMGRKDVLEPLLDVFYTRTVEDGATAYVRDESKRQLLVMHALVVALDVEGWAMAPSQLDALRAELKTTAGDLAARYRELGCTATSMRLPAGAGDGAPGGVGGGSSYTITLLRDGTRTLEECFPKPKTGPKQRGGR